mmetsp:Transcript_6231/g.14265  ORF Transcript_6231/g.14265 Transcript_6231/m.14265 type:complete len:289 (+) Transcript_6231:70-936(+)
MHRVGVCTLTTLLLCSTALDVSSSNAAAQAQLRASAPTGHSAEQQGHLQHGPVNAPIAAGPASSAGVAEPAALEKGGAVSWLRRVQQYGKGACLPLMAVLRHKFKTPETPTPSGSATTQPEADDEVSATKAAITWLTSQAVYLVLALIVGYFYKANKDWVLGQEAVKASEKNFKEWSSPEIEPILFWSFFCPSVRWADTMYKTGILPGFWQAMLLFILASTVSGLAFGLPGWLLMTCFLVVFRCKIRTKFEMQQSYVQDFCCYCFCQPCLVAQEARHVEEADIAGNLL